MALAVRHHRFSVEEYHRMAEAGIFHEDDRVELIDGEIVEMTPIGSRHVACVDKLTRLFTGHVGDRAIVRVQSPVRLCGEAEPQPDVALLRPRADFYAAGLQQASDVLLTVEVADTSLDYDLNVKVPLYARSGVPEVWVVDLEGEQVHVFRDPKGSGYGVRETLGRGESLRVPLAGVAALGVDDVIP